MVANAVDWDGTLGSATDTLGEKPFSIYVHVPFCATRCGYCDFNTYTANELGGFGFRDYVAAIHQEIALAKRVLGTPPKAATVFFGGGTPSLLGGSQFAEILDDLGETFGIEADAEITSEANPESVTPEWCQQVVSAGVNRLSLGMQSAVPHVLRILDRVHTPRRALEVLQLAREHGIEQVSLDLIFGTPGESLADWEESLLAALSVKPDHLSAYSLIVEDGTRLARSIAKGELPMTSEDDLADKYLLAENLLSQAGYENYEISNWSTSPSTRSEHNLAYWRGNDWWGFGPGAHSHVQGTRWWNRKLPRRWGERLASGCSPAESREILTAKESHLERVLLELRISDGLPIGVLSNAELERARDFVSRGLVIEDEERLKLTLAGRLLADAVTLEILG